jgi:pilus assembly protein Flp/PilA
MRAVTGGTRLNFSNSWSDKMKEQFLQFLRDEEGATAVEYGLIAALIAVAIILAVTNVGEQLAAIFQRIATALTPTA